MWLFSATEECIRRNHRVQEFKPTFNAGNFPKKDCPGKFMSELFVEGDVDHWVDHCVHVGQHVDPEYVPLQDLWQLKDKALKMG